MLCQTTRRGPLNKALAVWKDSIRELFARKSLHVMTLIMVVIAGIFFCLRATPIDQPAVITENTANIGVMVRRSDNILDRFQSSMAVQSEITSIEPITAEHRLSEEFNDGFLLRVDFHQTNQLGALVRSWYSFQSWVNTGEWNKDAKPSIDTDLIKTILEFLDDRYRDFGYDHVAVWEVSPKRFPNGLSANIALKCEDIKQLQGAYRLSVLDRVSIPWNGSLRDFQNVVQQAFGSTFAGFFGILIMISLSAGFIPNLLQRGTLDLILARPIGRIELLSYKYASGVLIVAIINLLYFVVGGLGLMRLNGDFSIRFLGCSLTLTAIFSVLYSVVILCSVLTRSESVSALVAFAVWGLSSTVKKVQENGDELLQRFPGTEVVVDTLHTILPKTADLAKLNDWFLASDRAHAAAIFAETRWTFLIGTTLLFMVVNFGLACYFFRRHDC